MIAQPACGAMHNPCRWISSRAKVPSIFFGSLVALWTGFTFVGYFTPIKDLGLEFVQMSMSSWEIFWTFFYGFATYGNAGFMREQVCKHMCPYARFQSAMFDKDTLIVTYDEERGEPRGARSRKADPVDIKSWVLVWTAPCAFKFALQGLIFAKACSTSALVVARAQMYVTL